MYCLHIHLVGGHTVTIAGVTNYTVIMPAPWEEGVGWTTWEIGYDLEDDEVKPPYIDRRAIVAVEVETVEPDAAA